MAIISQTFGLLGQVGVTPRRVQMVVTDSLAAVTTAGYLQFAGVNTNQVIPTDIFDIIYMYDVETGVGTYAEFVPSFSATNVITLVQVGGGTSGIVSPGTANDMAYYETTGSTVSPLATLANAALTTSAGGVPAMTHLLPSAVQLQIGSFNSGSNASATTFWRGDGTWQPVADTIASWVDVTSGTQTCAPNTGYICDNGASGIAFTLPTTIAQGQVIEIAGAASGGWTIVYGASQFIRYGNLVTTTTSGSLASTLTGDCVKLLCYVANTGFIVLSSQGRLTVT